MRYIYWLRPQIMNKIYTETFFVLRVCRFYDHRWENIQQQQNTTTIINSLYHVPITRITHFGVTILTFHNVVAASFTHFRNSNWVREWEQTGPAADGHYKKILNWHLPSAHTSTIQLAPGWMSKARTDFRSKISIDQNKKEKKKWFSLMGK